MQKEPEGDSARVCGACVCVCVRARSIAEKGARAGARVCVSCGGGVLCENNIGFFRQNELYYCIQP